MIDDATARALLAKSPALQVLAGEPLRVQRVRLFGNRGLLRLLFPKVTVTLENGVMKARPDFWAWFMVVMLTGGVIVEVTTDRVRYPREYPPEFIFILAAAFIAALIWETRRVKQLVEQALTARGAS
ncbi:MAG: hypothetical protein QM817_02010 [Archangium sp.]